MNDRPKALLEVGGETLIARLVRQLREGGVERIVIVVGHRGELIEQELGGVPGVAFLHNRNIAAARSCRCGPRASTSADPRW